MPGLSEETLALMGAIKAYGPSRRSYLRDKYAYDLNSSSTSLRKATAAKAAQEVASPRERMQLAQDVREISGLKGKHRRQEYNEKGYVGRFATNIAEHLQAAGEGFLEKAQSIQDVTKLVVGKAPSKGDLEFFELLEGAKELGNPTVAEGRGATHKAASGISGVASDIIGSQALHGIGGTKAVSGAWAAYQLPKSRDEFLKAGLSPGASLAAAVPVAGAVGAAEALIPAPLQKSGITRRISSKVTGAVTRKATKTATRKAIGESLEIIGRIAGETGEEYIQAGAEEAGLYYAGELSEDVERRDPAEVHKKGVEAAKQALPSVAPWVGGSGVGARIQKKQAVKERYKRLEANKKQREKEDHVIRLAESGKIPSRSAWKRLGLPLDEKGQVPPGGVRRDTIARMADEYIENAQIRAIDNNETPTEEQWVQWGLSPEVGRTGEERKVHLIEKFQQAAEQDNAYAEAAVQGEEAIPPPTEEETPLGGVSEAAGELLTPAEPETPLEGQQAVSEPQEAPELQPEERTQAGAPVRSDVAPLGEGETALNKESNIEIRKSADLTELNDEEVQSMDSVMSAVAEDGADRQSLDVAAEVMASRKGLPGFKGRSTRQISTYEHAAMVLAAHKLMGEKAVQDTLQTVAVEAGNDEGHLRATVRINEITTQLDLLTEATRHSRREIARALSIGRLRANAERYDLAGILDMFQKSKGTVPLTPEEKGLAADLDKKLTALGKESEAAEQKALVKEWAENKVAAQEILNANKPKKGVGKKRGEAIRKKAATKREDIKNQIRQMGLRVNDITGIPIEGAYLIGQLGVTYVQEGVGTLVGVIEKLQADMPHLDLTEQEVYRLLVMQKPGTEKQNRSDAAKRIADIRAQARIHVELDAMSRGVAEKIARNKAVPSYELTALRKKLTEARNSYYKSDMDATKLERAIEKVNRLQDAIRNGEKRIRKGSKEVPPELAEVHEQIRQLTVDLRLDQSLAEAEEQLRTGKISKPVKREKKPISLDVERKQIQLTQLRREIRQAAADMAPWDAKKVGKEIAYSAKAVAATADISFTMRQNFWQVFSHPISAAKNFMPAMRALKSQDDADRINNALLNDMPNSALYELAGVAIQDATSPDARQNSEVFQAKVIERYKIAGRQNPFGAIMSMSNRHAVTIGNLMRTSAFDQFMANNPNATMQEMRAMADYINVSTGLGNLGSFGAVSEILQLTFFSPRFAVSRVQTPYKLAQYWSMPRVRKQIAGDMVKVVGTGGMVLALASLAGATVIWDDPEDADWGKIRIGDMRIDIWGGFQQPARVIARTAKLPFEEDPKLGPLELLGRYAGFKVSPAFSIPIELIMGKTAVGEETTRLGTLARSVIPLVHRDMYEAFREEGIPAAAATGVLATLGMGVGTYKDSQTATRRRIKRLRSAGKYTDAEQIRLDWNQANPKNRIIKVS